MTKEYPMTNPKCPACGNDLVIRAWSLFRHYGLEISHSAQSLLALGFNQKNPTIFRPNILSVFIRPNRG
jgi:hypothetical protein